MFKFKESVAIYIRLLKYVKYYWVALVIAALSNMLFSGVDAGFIYLLKPILNKGFIDKDIEFIQFLPILVILAFIVRGFANCFGTYFMSVVSRGIVMRFRQEIFRKLLQLPAIFYDRTTTGKIISIIIYNVEQVANAGANALTDFVQSGFFIIGLLFVMFSISWRLSLLYFIFMPIIAITVRYTMKRLRRINLSIQKQMGDVTSIAAESIEGYKVIRAFGNEQYEINKFDDATKKNRFRELKIVVTKTLSISLIQLIAGIGLAVIVYLAISHKTSTALSAGSFASIMTAMLALLKPLKTFVAVNTTIQKGLAGAESVFELLDEEVEKDTGTLHVDRVKGDIEFIDVSFAYPDTDKNVLKNVNFSIKAGQTVAFVGQSGSGKTTIINLLQRFYDISSGIIEIDGINIKDFVLTDLRRQFSTVSQDVMLFNDTVAHNISYGRFDEVSYEEIIAAAKAANAWSFIEKLPYGLYTKIGENGDLLSGGQRQRIAIARAIIKDAPILILDEATSSLDTESEHKIKVAIDDLRKDRTTLVIAHRLSTVENADVIIVLDDGRIVEVGRHEELLNKGEYYTRLYRGRFIEKQEKE